MTKYITIRMTLEEALRQGLVICKCGHPVNNHFRHRVGPIGGCARCEDCLKYRPIARVGKFVKEAPKCRVIRAAPARTSSTSHTSSKRPRAKSLKSRKKM